MKKKPVCRQPMGSWFISRILGFQSKVEKNSSQILPSRCSGPSVELLSFVLSEYMYVPGKWGTMTTWRCVSYHSEGLNWQWWMISFWSTISLDIHALNFFHIIVNQLKNRCSVCFFIFVCYSSSMTDCLEQILRIVFHSCNYGWLQRIHCQLKNGFVK